MADRAVVLDSPIATCRDDLAIGASAAPIGTPPSSRPILACSMACARNS
jgi:hypothetical protein